MGISKQNKFIFGDRILELDMFSNNKMKIYHG